MPSVARQVKANNRPVSKYYSKQDPSHLPRSIRISIIDPCVRISIEN